MVMLYMLIVGTIILSYVRGRDRQPFWSSLAIEAGFLVAVLHVGYLTEGISSYIEFLIGWIMPVIGACLVADGLGRWIASRKEPG